MSNLESGVQIIPYYAHPHVFTKITDDSYYEETVAERLSDQNLPYSVLVVTGADKGIDNRLVRLTDIDTKKALFGPGNYIKYGQASIQADVLFNGFTNVWFMRVLPENATYANFILLAHYRKGKILDELGLETGKVRMEIKFSFAKIQKDMLKGGALTDAKIQAYAESLIRETSDPNTGYKTVPIMYVRSTGHGKYGNNYSMSITRDQHAEKEYGTKMYSFNLIDNEEVTRLVNQFAGSLVLSSYKDQSTLISDVLDQFSTGSCPVHIYPFEDSIHTLFDFYSKIIKLNENYVKSSGMNDDDVDELNRAKKVTIGTFDPLFGLVQDTQDDTMIPYYRNYTVPEDGKWQVPDLEIPNTAGAVKPLNISQWSSVFPGARVLVAADPFNNGQRWLYTVVAIDSKTGNIIYDEGFEVEFDIDQYDGDNISLNAGHNLEGGSDGDFEEITTGQVTRTPTAAEMKLLLSREYVKAFRGRKDRRILSPSRVNIDFIFDANYNLTSSETLNIVTNTTHLYNGSTILTNKDNEALSILADGSATLTFEDINVKRAMYDLNEFRNRNGMKINLEQGAGCLLHLDCGLAGNFSGENEDDANSEIDDIIEMLSGFTGRQTSIDLGFYEIFEPSSGRKVPVTATYYIAKKLIPHLIQFGCNKPFTMNYATISCAQRSVSSVVAGEMIRDTFRPDIDDIDWDIKEKLYKSRFNYWLVKDEGRSIKRATQNTRQLDASALLEENNVRVLNTLKKNMEKACEGYLYEWNDPSVRKSYTKAQMDIYKPWIGTIVEDLNIKFTANAWESDRMIMHCLVEVKFRNIVKRIILEINIQKPDYESDEES